MYKWPIFQVFQVQHKPWLYQVMTTSSLECIKSANEYYFMWLMRHVAFYTFKGLVNGFSLRIGVYHDEHFINYLQYTIN